MNYDVVRTKLSLGVFAHIIFEKTKYKFFLSSTILNKNVNKHLKWILDV